MQSKVTFRGFPKFLAWLVLAMVAVGAGAARVRAQDAPAYPEVPPKWDESDRRQAQEVRAREALIQDIYAGRAPFEGQNQADFREYFERHYFPKMTQVANLGELDYLRRNFFRRNFQGAASGMPATVHDALVARTFQIMRSIATNDFHPAVRFNAMLILGELNAQEATGFGTNMQPPVPYREALNVMLAELKKANQIDQVRMAALIGILRHTKIDRARRQLNAGATLDGATLRQIMDAMVQIAQEKNPPKGRSLAGHAWMRRRAIDVLMAMDASINPVPSMLEDIVTDLNEPLSLRLTAAEAIGRLPVRQGQERIDAAQTANHLVAMVVEAAQAELQWWDDEKKREEEKKLMQQGGYGGYPGMEGGYPGMEGGYPGMEGGYPGMEGGYPGMEGGYPGDMDYGYPGGMEEYGYPGMTAPKKKKEKKKVEPRLDRTQRRVKNCLYYVKLALDGDPTFKAATPKPRPGQTTPEPAAPQEKGLLAMAQDQQQKDRIKTLASAVIDLFGVVDTAEPEQETLLADLRTQVERLQGLAGPVAGSDGSPSGGPPSGGTPPGAKSVPRGPAGPAAKAPAPSKRPASKRGPASPRGAAAAKPAAQNNGAAP